MINKKILNIVLLLIFFVELSSNFFRAEIHEVIGGIFFVGILLHNFANKHFYKNFLRGRLTSQRILNHACIILFGLGILFLTLSGLALGDFFGKEISAAFNWRSLHLGAAIFSLIALAVHLLIHAKKYVQGRIFYAAAVLSFILAALGIFGLPYIDRWFHKVEVIRAEVLQGEKISTDKKVVTIYFSRVGNTDFSAEIDAVSGASLMKDDTEIIGNAEMIAFMAQSIIGGEIFELQTEKIYPAKYSETVTVAKEEFSSGELPTLKKIPAVESYDTIILIYPLWWGTLPKAVENFLWQVDLQGKNLIPIVTHGGGGFGESLNALKNFTGAEISEPLEIYSSDIPSSRETIFNFLQEQVSGLAD